MLSEVLDHLPANSMLVASDGDRSLSERTDVGIQSQQEVGKMGLCHLGQPGQQRHVPIQIARPSTRKQRHQNCDQSKV